MILLGKFSETIGVGDSLKDNFDKSKQCVSIADDYAVEFSEWCDKYICENCNGDGYTIEVEAECCRRSDYQCCGIPVPVEVQKQCYCSGNTAKELLPIFKKEKGL
jgi:hypothetical protein